MEAKFVEDIFVNDIPYSLSLIYVPGSDVYGILFASKNPDIQHSCFIECGGYEAAWDAFSKNVHYYNNKYLSTYRKIRFMVCRKEL